MSPSVRPVSLIEAGAGGIHSPGSASAACTGSAAAGGEAGAAD